MRQVAVIGPGRATAGLADRARRLGAELAGMGVIVVTGGLGGVMAAACRGAAEAGGLTVGLLPGTDPVTANPWVRVVIPTGLGEARNALVVRAAAVVVAVGGGWGTLSEVALALRAGIPVVSLDSWTPTPVGECPARGPEADAVRRVGDVTQAVHTVRTLLDRMAP
jgi:uncharacterized protein (TIGR00725 family)